MKMSDIPPSDDDTWTVAKGTFSSKPFFLRFRPGLKKFVGLDGYENVLIISWQLQSDVRDGLPSDEELVELKEFEGNIVTALDPERLGIFAFVLTKDGYRTWYFYIKNVEAVEKKLNEVLPPDLPISLEIENDEDWSELKTVYEASEKH